MDRIAPIVWSGFGALLAAGFMSGDWRGGSSFTLFVAMGLFLWGTFIETYR